MKTRLLQNKVSGALLAFAILFGIGIASSLTAQAQYQNDRDWQYRRDRDRDRDRRDDRYGRNGSYGNNGGYGGYNNIYRAAQNQGYQAGVYTGSSDAQRGQNYNPQRSHYYRNATDGYNSSYGNREGYKQAYRDGFLRGYDEGFRRYGGYNRGGYYPRNRTGSVLGGIFGRP